MKPTYCGKVDNKNVDTQVLINGWVKKNRKLGGLLFLDVADRYGLVQVVVNETNKFYEQILTLSKESVVQIVGTVKLRKDPNKSLPNGDVELVLEEFILLAKADPTPIDISDKCDSFEETRLKYRYLDLRRPIMRNKILFRSKMINALRSYLLSREFCEVETPNLSKATPEGARDYLVPTRMMNSFFALPQSPQIYKQLLMVSGLNRYFQIARCFRDEDLRADRQPEFTQLDMEMSFIEEQDIMRIIEKMFEKAFAEVLNINLTLPFTIMDYDVAMNEYGCDKPDLRFDLKLFNGSNDFANTNCKIIANGLAKKHVVKYIITNNILNQKQIDELRKYAKDNKAYDLIYLTLENNVVNGSIKNNIEHDLIAKLFTKHQLTSGTILLIVDTLATCNQALGAVRKQLGTMLNLAKPDDYKFV
jgi:aspartyl-tRNA synthetase